MALSGDRTMMIFALKNLCGWKDNPDFVDTSDSDPIWYDPNEEEVGLNPNTQN